MLNKWLLRMSWLGCVGLLCGATQNNAVASKGTKHNTIQSSSWKRSARQAPHVALNKWMHRTGMRAGIRGKRANTLLALRLRTHNLHVRTNGVIARYEVFKLENPARLVVDLHRVRRAHTRSIRRYTKQLQCGTHAFKSVRLGRHHNKVRIVLDACTHTAIPAFRIHLSRHGMRIVFARRNLQRREAAPQRAATHSIEDIGLGETQKHSSILLRIKGHRPVFTRTKQGKTVTLVFSNTQLARGLQQTLKTSDFQGAIQRIQSRVIGSNVHVSVSLKSDVRDHVIRQKEGIKWQFAMPSQGRKTTLAHSNYQIQYHPQQVGQAAVGGLSSGDLALMRRRATRKRYTGRRISIFFRKVEIHNLLRLFAEISGLNIITSGKVRGRVTLKLRNVPWDQALDLVLKTLKLGMERSGNIVRIATLIEFREEEQQRRRLQQLKLLSQPQKIRLIPVNYAKAQTMQAKVKSVLSPRGKVTIDNRTNVLIVKDYVPFLLRAEGLVRSLDTQTPQVLIQARIVEANVNFSQEFGIQWGGHLLFSPLTGNSTGLQFPNPVGIRGGVPATAGGGGGAGQQGTGEFGTPNYVINFPASTGVGQGTALSFLFGSLSGIGQLAMRLSAAESSGNVKIISSPKIITLHKMSASIQQGLQIPFSSASAAGTNVQFVTASLSLTVLPQVTADGSVFLSLNITNNAPDFSRGGVAGPAITTKTAQTNMLIKDGETMVIGGIYSRRTGESQARVPFLSKIPVLGLLFKNYKYNDDRAELLVFVTPRIVNRAKTLGGRQGS